MGHAIAHHNPVRGSEVESGSPLPGSTRGASGLGSRCHLSALWRVACTPLVAATRGWRLWASPRRTRSGFGLEERCLAAGPAMATLAESFLADLDELEEDEEDPEQQQQQKEEDLKNEMDVEGDLPEGLQFDDLHAVAKLYSSSRFQETVKVRDCSQPEASWRVRETDAGDESGNVVVNDEEHYKLIIDCNTLTVDIDNEIVVVHNFIRDKYRAKFPELESLVLNPLDYARVVRAIGNEMDMTLVDLSGLLPSATIMVVTVTGSTTNGKELSDNELQKVLEACDMALELDESKKLIFTFLESQMSRIAPNLSAVCGSTIAARLLGIAGGLRALAAMPACNIQVLGQRKKNLAGFSSATQQPHQGIIAQTEVVTQTPPAWKTKAIRLMANQCALMSRVDNFGEDPSGAKGKATLEEVKQKIEKWQEAPPAKTAKPLPVPDAEKKKRRLAWLTGNRGPTEMSEFTSA
eukprot:scaffold7576_cov417-Prasinococcus_capsulatus_cf.AAC.11